mmetsp:Transcript_5784/g.14440  ORF Transcript_5784/g.14440 Transcript_5784/m.14440 type:complete len:500 (+) Transcript_5784:108-1607(+)
MIGGSFLSLLPQGLLKFAVDGAVCGVVPNSGVDKVRKRRRDDVGGSRTPNLVLSPTGVFSCGSVREHDSGDGGDRPTKRLRGERKIDEDLHLSSSSSPQPSSNEKNSVTCDRHTQKKKGQKTKNQTSDLIKKLPADIVSACFSFVGSTEDRYTLQNTCKLFRDVSNSEPILKDVDIVGDLETGEAGIIQEHDTPASASAALVPFARAGNLQALYMLGIVKCYCYQDLKNGIHMLTMASSRGYLRSSYTLGIILRDALVEEASQYMNIAASAGYLPALQEVLPAREMKERFGEPNADELRRHLDPVGLNRLLLRDYVNSAELRGMNTSHCWNPLCGKWAYKASSNANNSSNPNLRMRRSSSSSAVIQPTYDVDENMLDSSPSNNTNENEGTIFPQRGEEIGGTRGTVNNNNSIGFNNRLHRRRHNHSFNPIAAVGGHGLSLPTRIIQSQSWFSNGTEVDRVARMKMCSRCCRAKYCSKLCQVYDWRSSQHKNECQYLSPH